MPKRLQKCEKFDKITQVKGRKKRLHIGDSPSGKATDSDSVIRVFESLIPSHKKAHQAVCFFCAQGIKRKNFRVNRVVVRTPSA